MILHGDALTVLSTLPDASVDSCVTSSPYWKLRDYHTEPVHWPAVDFAPAPGLPSLHVPAQTCELGQEHDVWAFVAHLVLIYRQVHRVLRQNGVALLNLGDTYAGSQKAATRTPGAGRLGRKTSVLTASERPAVQGGRKQLVGVPWKVAFALQADGWLLRQDIVWHKRGGLPESVTDRCTRAHEMIFHVVKAGSYYWDNAALAEPLADSSVARLNQDLARQQGSDRQPGHGKPMKAMGKLSVDARLRMPEHGGGVDAGSSTDGGVTQYVQGAPEKSRRHLDTNPDAPADTTPQYRRALELAEQHHLHGAHLNALQAVELSGEGYGALQSDHGRNSPETARLADEARAALGSSAREFLTAGTRNRRSVWSIAPGRSSDEHYAVMSPQLARDLVLASTPPGGVCLDPFAGSGTTLQAAASLGREFIGIELHPANVALSRRNVTRTQPGLNLTGRVSGHRTEPAGGS